MEDKDVKNIAVIDSTHEFINKIPENATLKFKYLKNADINKLRYTFESQGYWGVLYIPDNISYAPSAELFSKSQPNISTKQYIQSALEKEIERQKLLTYNIDNIDNILKSVKTNISLKTITLEDNGKSKEGFTELSMIVGYASGFLIYLFILLFGTQVMRGVIEEKTSRIVEVIVSSVKPFELMMGKIIGIAGVGLLQFLIWIVLTTAIFNAAQGSFAPQTKLSPTEQVVSKDILKTHNTEIKTQAPALTQVQPLNNQFTKFEEIVKALKELKFALIIGAFLFYFIGGYLLYASLFAAVGSAVDSETDTQQFMLPITIPLILAIYVMISTINNPDSSLSFWFSMIPLTSPIVMMVRIPFGVPNTQLIASALILIASFIGTTWLAGKIYRTGILMYGKKVSYKELWKWVKYKG
jgi:ABC-2 type transport system permease protein